MNINKIFIKVFAVLSVLIILLIALGDRTYPKVESFNFENQSISPSKNQLIITFNREIDKESVEKNFEINPKVDGKTSFIGRKMAFTANQTLQYGQKYEIKITNFKDINNKVGKAFEASFQTENRKIIYISTEDKTKRNLISYDLVTKEKINLSPNYKIYEYDLSKDGRIIIFKGLANNEKFEKDNLNLSLYQLDLETKKIKKISDRDVYKNYSFDLSNDGSTLAIFREKFKEKGSAIKLETYSTSQNAWEEFWYQQLVIDKIYLNINGSLIMGIHKTDGFVLLPFVKDTIPPQFIGSYLDIYGFSKDSQKVAMTDFTDVGAFSAKSNILVIDSSGEKYEIAKDTGEIDELNFNNSSNKIYFLMSIIDEYKSEYDISKNPFHIYEYDFKNGQIQNLTGDENYSDNEFDISPDDKMIVFERFLNSGSQNVSPQARNISETINDEISSPALFIEDIEANEITDLGVDGRDAKWEN